MSKLSQKLNHSLVEDINCKHILFKDKQLQEEHNKNVEKNTKILNKILNNQNSKDTNIFLVFFHLLMCCFTLFFIFKGILHFNTKSYIFVESSFFWFMLAFCTTIISISVFLCELINSSDISTLKKNNESVGHLLFESVLQYATSSFSSPQDKYQTALKILTCNDLIYISDYEMYLKAQEYKHLNSLLKLEQLVKVYAEQYVSIKNK